MTFRTWCIFLPFLSEGNVIRDDYRQDPVAVDCRIWHEVGSSFFQTTGCAARLDFAHFPVVLRDFYSVCGATDHRAGTTVGLAAPVGQNPSGSAPYPQNLSTTCTGPFTQSQRPSAILRCPLGHSISSHPSILSLFSSYLTMLDTSSLVRDMYF